VPGLELDCWPDIQQHKPVGGQLVR
jgi:hypothetical protein